MSSLFPHRLCRRRRRLVVCIVILGSYHQVLEAIEMLQSHATDIPAGAYLRNLLEDML